MTTHQFIAMIFPLLTTGAVVGTMLLVLRPRRKRKLKSRPVASDFEVVEKELAEAEQHLNRARKILAARP